MRITRIVIEGFRAFSSATELDLDAETVIVIGANGQGKTSLLDAVLWAITGDITRMGEKASVISLFSPTGEARVELTLKSHSDEIRIARVAGTDGESLRLTRAEKTYSGADANYELVKTLWPQASAENEPLKLLAGALTTSVYLEQDCVRDFVAAADDSERFSAVSGLVGARRIEDFQIELESARKSWATATNRTIKDVEALTQRIESLERRANSVSSRASADFDSSKWQQWWASASNMLPSLPLLPDDVAMQSPSFIDTALRELGAAKATEIRQINELNEIAEIYLSLERAADVDAASLKTEVTRVTEELRIARESLAAARKESAKRLEAAARALDERDQIQVMARIALDHLGEHCPVCAQEIDESAVSERLRKMMVESDGESESAEKDDGIEGAARGVSALEAQLESVTSRLRHVESLVNERMRFESSARDIFERAAVAIDRNATIDRSTILWAIDQLDARIEATNALLAEGEQFSLALARESANAAEKELEEEIRRLRQRLVALQSDIEARERTSESVTNLLNGLRDAGTDAVIRELDRIEPLLQQIFATADPHPAFRVAELVATMKRGRGRLTPSVIDPIRAAESSKPQEVLSSSQLNVLAVSIFLALNLGVREIPVKTIMLDDPLQSLDDINLLGLTDLLRRARDRRQLFVTTHDRRFAALMERKLRPIGDSGRTLVIELNAWSPDDLRVTTREVVRDSKTLRLVA